MKKYILNPTPENLLNTYKSDAIGRNDELHRFVEYLNIVDDSQIIALDGSWGSGKTFFVKQTKMIMDAYNSFIENEDNDYVAEVKSFGNQKRYILNEKIKPQVTVYYDAWENDNDDDPILSIVYSILQDVDNDYKFKAEDGTIEKAMAVLDVFSGRSFSNLYDKCKSKDFLETLREARDIKHLVDDFLESLLPEKGDRLIVIIDELDRCKPDYAVKTLERIKHYFSNDRITFIFSVNLAELQHTIKKCYGSDFDACRYLERFFDLTVTLSPPDYKSYYFSIGCDDSMYNFDLICKHVADAMNLSLRERGKFLLQAKIAAYKPTHKERTISWSEEDDGVLYAYMYILPIMIGLKMCDISKYNRFISGEEGEYLANILLKVNGREFKELLNDNETYEDFPQKKVISKRERFIEMYKSIFSMDSPTEKKRIGKYIFSERTKEELLRTIGLLSKNSSFGV